MRTVLACPSGATSQIRDLIDLRIADMVLNRRKGCAFVGIPNSVPGRKYAIRNEKGAQRINNANALGKNERC